MDNKAPNTDEFADYCGKIYAKKLKEALRREVKEPDFMPHEDFDDCRSRMKAISSEAEAYVDDFKGLAAANHRALPVEDGGHGDDMAEEIESLSSELDQEDVEVAALWFW